MEQGFNASWVVWRAVYSTSEFGWETSASVNKVEEWWGRFLTSTLCLYMGMHSCTPRHTHTNGNMCAAHTHPLYTWKKNKQFLAQHRGELQKKMSISVCGCISTLCYYNKIPGVILPYKEKLYLIYCSGDSRARSQHKLARLWWGPHGGWHQNCGTVLGEGKITSPDKGPGETQAPQSFPRTSHEALLLKSSNLTSYKGEQQHII